MKRMILSLAFMACLPAAAQAACYAEYKAKQDSPLRLHYGIMQVDSGGCPSRASARNIVATRLGTAGWTLLNVVSLSETAPSAQQRANAGEHYLRY